MKTTSYPFVDVCINSTFQRLEILDCKEFLSPIATKVKILLAILKDSDQGDSYYLIRQDQDDTLESMYCEVDYMESIPEDWYLYRFGE